MAKDTGLGDPPSATSNRAAAAPNTNERGVSRIIVVSHHQPRLSNLARVWALKRLLDPDGAGGGGRQRPR